MMELHLSLGEANTQETAIVLFRFKQCIAGCFSYYSCANSCKIHKKRECPLEVNPKCWTFLLNLIKQL